MSARPVVCIVGPTASGKSDLAQDVAERCGGEIVSADAMQVYRGMDIGTGKVPLCERRVPHHGLDLVEPGEPYSAALFQAHARELFSDIAGRGARPLLVGGTGFYVRAAIDDYDFPPGDQTDNPVRERWQRFADEHGGDAVWEELRRVDPQSAEMIHPHEVKRAIRAFELLEAGESYARQRERLKHLPQAVDAVLIGLSVDPEVLGKRIDARVDTMIAAGLVEEVEGLLDQGLREGITAPQAIGYKEVVAALDGRCSLDEAVADIKRATRRYAKRQRTWFRRDARIRWFDADAIGERAVREKLVSDILRIVEE